ncbi:hypothetical protein N7539_008034 [Penicillium diatomitis]|uniref:Uncharacterized protein n=1 Tax=Penicillium diatomitis TaxID=2819901 RepID=A0A9W9WTJ2_9EURO|nr:uncharacterized protein N7539_008034 [Penicillium diatomitis]KAJ5474968.1 hypothetical protein N7539_008034 [Penicillium diatomitis]
MSSSRRQMTSSDVDRVLGLTVNNRARDQVVSLLDSLFNENNFSSLSIPSERVRFRQLLRDTMSAEVHGQSSRFPESVLSAFRHDADKCVDALYVRARLNRKARQCRETHPPRGTIETTAESVASTSRTPATLVPGSSSLQPAASPAAAPLPTSAQPVPSSLTEAFPMPTPAAAPSAAGVVPSPARRDVRSAYDEATWPIPGDGPFRVDPNCFLRFQYTDASGRAYPTLEWSLGGMLGPPYGTEVCPYWAPPDDLCLSDIFAMVGAKWGLTDQQVSRLDGIEMRIILGERHWDYAGWFRFCWDSFLAWATEHLGVPGLQPSRVTETLETLLEDWW